MGIIHRIIIYKEQWNHVYYNVRTVYIIFYTCICLSKLRLYLWKHSWGLISGHGRICSTGSLSCKQWQETRESPGCTLGQGGWLWLSKPSQELGNPAPCQVWAHIQVYMYAWVHDSWTESTFGNFQLHVHIRVKLATSINNCIPECFPWVNQMSFIKSKEAHLSTAYKVTEEWRWTTAVSGKESLRCSVHDIVFSVTKAGFNCLVLLGRTQVSCTDSLRLERGGLVFY